jgi:hypothetical protein
VVLIFGQILSTTHSMNLKWPLFFLYFSKILATIGKNLKTI